MDMKDDITCNVNSPTREKPKRKNVHYRNDTQKSKQPADYTSEQEEAVMKIENSKNHYEILGLTKEATEKDVTAAYRRLARQLHPDKNNHPRAEEAFKVLKNSYNVLNDDYKRRQCDMQGNNMNYKQNNRRHEENYNEQPSPYEEQQSERQENESDEEQHSERQENKSDEEQQSERQGNAPYEKQQSRKRKNYPYEDFRDFGAGASATEH